MAGSSCCRVDSQLPVFGRANLAPEAGPTPGAAHALARIGSRRTRIPWLSKRAGLHFGRLHGRAPERCGIGGRLGGVRNLSCRGSPARRSLRRCGQTRPTRPASVDPRCRPIVPIRLAGLDSPSAPGGLDLPTLPPDGGSRNGHHAWFDVEHSAGPLKRTRLPPLLGTRPAGGDRAHPQCKGQRPAARISDGDMRHRPDHRREPRRVHFLGGSMASAQRALG